MTLPHKPWSRLSVAERLRVWEAEEALALRTAFRAAGDLSRVPDHELIAAMEACRREIARRTEAAASAMAKRVATGAPELVFADGVWTERRKAEVGGLWDAPSPFLTPFKWRDPATMPRRQWLYGRHYIRKFVSATFAPGGVGKSALVLAEAMAMASGRSLIGDRPRGRFRVGYWNGEDPLEETMRRALAATLLHGLAANDLEEWLFLGSGREQEVLIAEQTAGGALILQPNVEAVTATIQALALDVVIIDPFVSSHRVTENDNNAIDMVAKQWGKIADETNTSIELVHHTRKTNGVETTVEDGRGASALLAATRSARVLNAMSKDERERAGVKPTEAYFRVANGKANLAPPAEGADWYQVVSIDLGNGDAEGPSDNVGAVRRWKWPDPFDDVTADDLIAVQAVIEGGRWRADIQAKAWAGHAVAQALGLDLDDKEDKQKAKALLATWLRNGVLKIVSAPDDGRKDREWIEVGKKVENE